MHLQQHARGLLPTHDPEVQVLGDAFGSVLELGERECSIQRRYQKLVEESPAPHLPPEVRASLAEAALRLARAAGYQNAGTVEFILDEAGQFFFLEVNARLQVEHPVTELVTGLDLVELQLRVAAGEPLPLRQADVRRDGHAIECRVIAEDPRAGFLPSPGRVGVFAPPVGVGIRNDVGVNPGSLVPSEYDSLLAKLVVAGRDRMEAVVRLRRALGSYRVAGVQTNLDLLRAIAASEPFAQGFLSTRFLDEHRVIDALDEAPAEVVAAAALADLAPRTPSSVASDPWRNAGAWRLGRFEQRSQWEVGARLHEAVATEDLQTGEVEVVLADARVRGRVLAPGVVHVGTEIAHVDQRDDGYLVTWKGRTYDLRRGGGQAGVAEARPSNRTGGVSGLVVAPMPGRVARVAVRTGESVGPHQRLVVLEAMKMEHVLEAPAAGVVRSVEVAPGDQVTRGQVLVEVGAPEQES